MKIHQTEIQNLLSVAYLNKEKQANKELDKKFKDWAALFNEYPKEKQEEILKELDKKFPLELKNSNKEADRVKTIPLNPKKEPRKYQDEFFMIEVPVDKEDEIVKHVQESGYNVKGTGEGSIVLFDEDDVGDVQLFLSQMA